MLSGLIGAATSVWQVGILRAGAWTARGLRVPARNALLADLAPPAVYGRAYGFERSMDNLGALVGPIIALLLVTAVGTRTAIFLSIIPGLLATVAILYAIGHTRRANRTDRPPTAHPGPPRAHQRPQAAVRRDHRLRGRQRRRHPPDPASHRLLDPVDPTTTPSSSPSASTSSTSPPPSAAFPPADSPTALGPLRILLAGVILFGLAYAGLAIDTVSIPPYSPSGSSPPDSPSAVSRPPSTLPSPPTPPPSYTSSPSVSSLASRASATSPPASSRARADGRAGLQSQLRRRQSTDCAGSTLSM